MSTPNDTYTSMLRGLCVVLSMTLFGCGPEIGIGWGDSGTGDDTDDDCPFGGCTAPVDTPYECVPPAALVVECDQDTLCWTWSAGWSSWAQYAEPTDIVAAIDGGILVPTQDDLVVDAVCFDLLGATHHVCVVEVDCIGLLGRPAAEVGMVQSECSAKGPWGFVGETQGPFGSCWGVVGGVAVMLDPQH